MQFKTKGIGIIAFLIFLHTGAGELVISAELNAQTGYAVRPGWNGLRAGLSVCFSLPGRNN